MRLLALLAVVVVTASGCFSSCSPTMRVDTCSTPTPASITLIEAAASTTSDSSSTPFVALASPSEIASVRGGQGAEMIVVRLRFSGSVGDCLDLDATVIDPLGQRVAEVKNATRTYPDAAGLRVTNPLYLAGATSGFHRLHVVAGGATLDVPLYIDKTIDPTRCDVAVDCAARCGWEPQCQAACVAPLTPPRRAAYDGVTSCVAQVCNGALAPDGGFAPACHDLGCAGCLANADSNCRQALTSCDL